MHWVQIPCCSLSFILKKKGILTTSNFRNFGIHLFENLELPRRIKEIQSVMSDLQKMYQFYKGEVSFKCDDYVT